TNPYPRQEENPHMRKISLFLSMLLIFVFISTGTLGAAAASDQPDEEILAHSALLINTDTGKVVYSNNTQDKMYPASITKIMTAVLLLESVQDLDNTTATATSEDMEDLYGTGASTADIRIGETLTMRDYLNAMLIPSGNEAANIVANALGPGIPAF